MFRLECALLHDRAICITAFLRSRIFHWPGDKLIGLPAQCSVIYLALQQEGTMESIIELSPAQFRQAYPDRCFACHCVVKDHRYEADGLVACSDGCAAKLKRDGVLSRMTPPVPWATDDEEALLT